MNIRPVGADMFHAGRHDEVIVSFRNFAQAPQQRDAAMSPSYAVTTPLKIMLFCKHLQATHPTHLSVGTLGTWCSQPVGKLGVSRVQSRLLWKANSRMACKNGSPNATSHILFLLYSVRNASNKIHLSKEHATFQFCASSRPQTPLAAILPPQFCVHSTVYDVVPRLQTDS